MTKEPKNPIVIKIPVIIAWAILTATLCGFAFMGGYGLSFSKTVNLEAQTAALWVKMDDLEQDIRLLRNGYSVLSAEAYKSGMQVPTFLLDLNQDTVLCTLRVAKPEPDTEQILNP